MPEENNKPYRFYEGNVEVPGPVVKEPRIERRDDRLYVDGYQIKQDATAMQCTVCGAIFQRLGFVFGTEDPRGRTCDHKLEDLKEVAT